MNSTPAIHTLWTAPHAARDPGRDGYRMPLAELLTLVLSVRSWQEFHGPVHLYTDERGLAAVASAGLDGIYDRLCVSLDGIDTKAIDPIVYYTGAKLVALAAETAPVAMLDLDLYLRRPVPIGAGFTFAHWELANSAIYPPPELVPGALPFLDVPVPPRACNTAVAVFVDEAHRAAFVRAALSFMEHNASPADLHPTSMPAFCEQRLVLIEAIRARTPVAPVVDTMWDSQACAWVGPPPVDAFHHTWFHKRWLASDRKLYASYCRKLLDQLRERYPADCERVQSIPCVRSLEP